MKQYILFFSLLLLTSCREEIIAPDSTLSNINQPSKNESSSSYSFDLSANDLTIIVNEGIDFGTNRFRLICNLKSNSQGYVQVRVTDKDGLLYKRILTSTVNVFENISGNPQFVFIQFVNFTGEFSLSLKETF